MKRIRALLSSDRIGGQTVMAFGLKGVGAAAAFAMSWLIARAFGAAGAGTWGLVVTTVGILAVVAAGGLDTQLMRAAAGDHREKRPDLAAAAVRAVAWRLALSGGIGAALLWLAHAPVAARVLHEPAAGPVLALLAWTIPALVMVRIASVALRAGGRLFASQAIDGPLGTLLAASLLALAVFTGDAPTLEHAAVFQLVGTGVAAITAWALYHWLVRRGVAASAAPPVGPMAAAGIPVLLAGLTVAFSDWYPAVVVAAHWPVAEVGLLRVAMQFVALAALLQLAMEAVMGPRIAAAARVNDTAEIAHVVRRSVMAVMLLASPLLLVLLVFPGELMRLFGPEFAAGAATLQILAVGQAVRLASGPLGTVLIMTGHQRWLLLYSLAGVVLTIGFALWLIPLYGAPGAAAAGAITLVFRNAAALWMVQNKAGVRLFRRARGS